MQDYQKERMPRLRKEYPDLAAFMDEVLRQGRYRDVHSGNFLKDEDGSYKIIDLEGFINTPLSRGDNDWITR
jgi:hypothetical protein